MKLLVTVPSRSCAYPPSSIILHLLHQEPKKTELPTSGLSTHCQSSPSSEIFISMPNPQISLEKAFSSTSSTPRRQPQCGSKTTRSQLQVLQGSNFSKLSPSLRVKNTWPNATISCQFCSNKYKYRAGLLNLARL